MTHATKTHFRTTHFRTSRSLRSAAKLGLGLLSLLSLSAGHAAFAAPITWSGPTGTDWFATRPGLNTTYWSNGSVPGAADDAQNTTGNAMTLGQSTTINSFFSSGAFTLQGGTFSGSQASAASTLQVNNVFTDDGGQINNFTVNQGTGGSLVFTGSGGNSISGSIINSSMDLATNNNAFLNINGVNTVNGAITLGTASNGLRVQDGNANLILSGTGSLVGFGSVFQGGGNATLTNNGTLNANSSGKTLAVQTDNFTNAGTAEATNGGILTLAANTTTTNSGALEALGTGSVVSITGSFTSAGNNLITAMNGGQVQVGAANLYGTINEASGTALVLDNSAKSFHATTINGGLNLATNLAAFVNFDGVNTVNGQISLGTTTNGIQVQDGNANLILSGTGSLVGFGNVFQSGGNATLTNNGLINATGGTLAIQTDIFANTGTVQVQNGATLTTAGNTTVTDSGNILVAKGGTATLGQPLIQTAGLTQVDGTLNSPLTLTGGTLAGTGTVVGNVANSGGMVSAGNSASPFGTLAVSGTFSQTSGALDVGFSNTQNNLLKVSGAVTTGGVLNVSYLGAGPFTAGNAPFTFLDYGSLTSSITGTGPTQYFSNETFDMSGNGLIVGSNGFTYDLVNNTSIDGLQLEVLKNGAPAPAVPEASTTVSMGLLLALGGGGLLIAKRRRTVSAAS